MTAKLTDDSRQRLERMSPGARTVVRAIGRPSLLVEDDEFEKAVSDEWSELLEKHRGALAGSAPSCGRAATGRRAAGQASAA